MSSMRRLGEVGAESYAYGSGGIAIESLAMAKQRMCSDLPQGWGTLPYRNPAEYTSDSECGGDDSRRSSFNAFSYSTGLSQTSGKMGLGFITEPKGRMEEDLKTDNTNESPTRVAELWGNHTMQRGDQLMDASLSPPSMSSPMAIPMVTTPAMAPSPHEPKDRRHSEGYVSAASDTDHETRKEIRRMKNRESAQKSRAKRIEYIENMELTVAQLADENKHLQLRLELLRKRQQLTRKTSIEPTLSFNDRVLRDKVARAERQQGYRYIETHTYELCRPLQQLVGVSRVSGAQAVELLQQLAPRFLQVNQQSYARG